jgi:cell division septal protein FtsQ
MSEQDRQKAEKGKDPMSPEKINEHEPTAVKRDASDQIITEQGQTGKNPEEAREVARSKGMAKGEAGAAPTGDEYEQGAAGTNK